MTARKLLCPSYGKGYILLLRPPNVFLRGQKWSKISKTNHLEERLLDQA